MNMLDDLIALGLSHHEAEIYLILLEIGPSTVTEIARKSHVGRTNCYNIVNDLLVKGLVNAHDEKGKTIYSAENPERIVTIIHEQLKKNEEMLKKAQMFVPELQSIFHEHEGKLKVRYYEGVEGLVSIYEDTLTAKETILGYASVENQHSFFPGYFPEYYERRTRRKIPVKAILAYTKDSFRIKNLDKKHLRITKIVPKKFQISPEINIYDNKTAILSLQEKFGVIIESKEVAAAFKKLFELAWEQADTYDKKIGKKYVENVKE